MVLLTSECVFTQCRQNFYIPFKGIIYRNNLSVSPANIVLHFPATPAFSILINAAIYKNIIDYIIFIAIGENSMQTIIKSLENSLGNVRLIITDLLEIVQHLIPTSTS